MKFDSLFLVPNTLAYAFVFSTRIKYGRVTVYQQWALKSGQEYPWQKIFSENFRHLSRHGCHMPDLPIFLTQWLLHYGEYAVFIFLALGIIGLPIPDETLLAFTGFLIAQHKVPLMPTVIAAILGAFSGITVSYLLGRTIGHFLIERYGSRIGITQDKIKRVHNWFEQMGKWTLFLGYFVPGVRHLTGYVAGTTQVHFATFMMFAYSGAFLWCLGFISLGYFFSHNWQLVADTISKYLWLGVGVTTFIIVFYAVWRIFKHHYRSE